LALTGPDNLPLPNHGLRLRLVLSSPGARSIFNNGDDLRPVRQRSVKLLVHYAIPRLMVTLEFGDGFFVQFSMAQRIQVVLQIKDFDLPGQRIANRPVYERFVTFRFPTREMINCQEYRCGKSCPAKSGDSPIAVLDDIVKDSHHFFLRVADFEHEPQWVENVWRA
jgi:hypothetical protein